jgi:methylglutaconyl-CoA hydratase
MIKTELLNHTAIIKLNRPEKRNALHPEMIKQLLAKLDELENQKDINSVVITGEGNTFCSGADLEHLVNLKSNSLNDNYEDSKSLAELYLRIYNFPKLTIAAVNGPAIAGGCGLATVCDFIITNPEQGKFGYSEVKIGFIPAIVSIFLIKKIGESKAKEMLITGNQINGNKAFELGLANYLYNNVLDGALEVINSLSLSSFDSINLTKDMINKVSELSVNEAVNYSLNLNLIARSSEDFKKGIERFLRKEK